MFLYELFQTDFQILVPQFFITLLILILLLFCVFLTNTIKTFKIINKKILNPLIIYFLFYTVILIWNTPITSKSLLNGVLVFDQLSKFVHLFLITCLLVHFIIQSNSFTQLKMYEFENSILLLLSTLGLLVVSSSYNLISVYLALELQSLSFYILAASKRSSPLSAEAALKYFILGSIASGFILLGSSIIYSITGSLNFGDIFLILSNINQYELLQFILPFFYGLFFLTVGLLFKIGAVPFHSWLPDVYEGSPNHITFFFTILPKIALVTLLIRLFFDVCLNIGEFFVPMFYFCSILSIFIGSLLSLQQQKIKRLLAYSSISHVGFLLIGFTTNSFESITYIIFYLIIYITMSINIWTTFLSLNIKDKPFKYLTNFTNLARVNPTLSFIIALNLFSMAGVPPLGGFFSKMFIFMSAIKSNNIGLAIIGILFSTVCAFYYIRLIKTIYFDKVVVNLRPIQTTGKSESLIITTTIFGVVFFFIFPEYLMIYLHLITCSYIL